MRVLPEKPAKRTLHQLNATLLPQKVTHGPKKVTNKYMSPVCNVADSASRSRPGVPSGNSVSLQYECNTPTEKGKPHTRSSITVAAARNDQACRPRSTGGSAEKIAESGASSGPLLNPCAVSLDSILCSSMDDMIESVGGERCVESCRGDVEGTRALFADE